MSFTPRLTKPEKGNKYYITKERGGYSPCIVGSPTDKDCDVLSNCVGYALGRFNEIGGYGSCKYLRSVNAENFIKYKGDLEVGQTPKLGAVIVWQKGATLSGSDGAGHVAIVEKIVDSTTIVTSESGWGSSTPFWTKTRKKGSDGNWGQNSTYKFLGFIYNPAVKDVPAPIKTTPLGKNPTNKALADFLINIAKCYKTLYVSGCFGAPLNDKNKERYCNNNDYNRKSERQKMIMAASSDTFGFDCVCLIKGVLWGWNADVSKTYGGASYKANDVPDIGANSMIKVCKDVSTDFAKIEVGEAVWMEGHIGVYVGNGLAVECTPKMDNKVQITACNRTVSGYNKRTWTKHGKLPYVVYLPIELVADEPVKPVEPTKKELKIGDIVTFTGTKHYNSANALLVKSCKGGIAKVTNIFNVGKSKHPYHLVKVSGGGSTVYGWVNAEDIEELHQTEPEPETPAWTPAVGDIVKYNGSVHYSSANGTTAKSCKGGEAKITQIYKLGKSKHPYHLKKVSGKGATVYGWVDAGTFTKV